MNSKANSPFLVNLHELPRRAGEMREYHLSFEALEPIGTPLLEIRTGESLTIDFKAEAVSDGVLLTGSVSSRATGECGRCLEKIDKPVYESFQELFLYENRGETDDDESELFRLDGDLADLEIPIRDAVVLAMPLNPLCRPDCLGLCSECGERWDKLEPGHSHEIVDPRWSGLAGWTPE